MIQIIIKNDKDVNLTSNLNNNPKKRHNQKKIKRLWLYIKSFFPFFLSHHPDCTEFESHTIKFAGLKLCIGCFVGYPTAIITFLVVDYFSFIDIIPVRFFFLLSIVFLSFFFLSPLGLIKNKILKICQKILIGIGAALLFIWIMELPNLKRLNLYIAYNTLYFLLLVLNLYHVYGNLSKCYKCGTPFDWGKCPGFCSIRKRMEEFNLNNFLSDLEGFSDKIKARRALKNKNLDNH